MLTLSKVARCKRGVISALAGARESAPRTLAGEPFQGTIERRLRPPPTRAREPEHHAGGVRAPVRAGGPRRGGQSRARREPRQDGGRTRIVNRGSPRTAVAVVTAVVTPDAAPDLKGPERRLRQPPARSRKPKHHPRRLRTPVRARRPRRNSARRDRGKPRGDDWLARVKRAGLSSESKRLSLHSLRHGFASLLIANGLDVVFVSRQLGHANPTVTLSTYAHLF
jgi:hypothetical protein